MLVLYPFVLVLLLSQSSTLSAETIPVGEFSKGNLSGWEEKEFDGKMLYSLKQVDEKTVLESISDKAASGLFKKIPIDLSKIPVLHWSWKIKNTLSSDNERSKSGDDFSARLYIVFSDGPFFWQTKTLNYVWANQANIGDQWANSYTTNAQMLAIQTGNEKSAHWQVESRNVLDDIQEVFGKSITEIKAIAIMSDTDQTGASAQAWFGDIWFSN